MSETSIAEELRNSVGIDSNLLEVEVEFTLKEGGIWYRTTMNCNSYLEILRNGTVEGKPIAAVKVCTVTDPDAPEFGTCNFIYDFILAKSGAANPWRIFGS